MYHPYLLSFHHSDLSSQFTAMQISLCLICGFDFPITMTNGGL
jgi:hypothetical protein